jgi:CheY-like chemotaxis protein
MTNSWTAPGSHAVQFYEDEQRLHHTIAEFFTQGARGGSPLILVSRSRTFEAVARHLSSGRYGPAIDVAGRVLFTDAEASLPEVMEGETLNPARAESLFRQVLSQAPPGRAHLGVRLYAEMTDILCQRGDHAAALEVEGIANTLIETNPRLSILSGYAIERFKDDTNSARFRAVCQKHTHVIPAESFGDLLRTHYQQAAMLEHNARDRMLPTQHHRRMGSGVGAAPAQTVYVIEDDASLRRALGRLLTASAWPVRTFHSAEAFLAELDKLSSGCLVVDIELQGMGGLELVRRLNITEFSWPIIMMSGLQDKETESEALRLGARAFLRKPFDMEVLLAAIAQALL